MVSINTSRINAIYLYTLHKKEEEKKRKRKVLIGGRVGQSPNLLWFTLFPVWGPPGTFSQQTYLSCSLMCFYSLFLFLRNSIPEVESLGHQRYVSFKIDLAKLPSKKAVPLYIPASNMWELPSSHYQQTAIGTMALCMFMCVCVYFLSWRISNMHRVGK